MEDDNNAPGGGLTLDESATIETPNTTMQPAALPDDDGDLADATLDIEHRGQRGQFVPAGTLAEERKARRAATKEATELKAQLAEATTRTSKLEQDIAQVIPIVNAVRNRPDLLREALGQTAPSTRQPTTGGPDGADIDEATAREVAQEYELFDANGQPDVARGRRAIARMKNMARSMAQEEVAPLRNATIHEKARANIDTLGRYVAQGDISQEALDAAYKLVPEQLLADAGVMSVLYYFAKGLDSARGKGGKAGGTGAPAAPSAPILSEPAGRRPAQNGPLSDVEQTVAKSRGMSTEQYRSHLKDLPEYGNPIALE